MLVAATLMMLWNLGYEPLALYDEQTYTHVLGQSFERGDFLTFSTGDKFWFEKPPLYFWLAGVAQVIFGEGAFALRLPSALAGVGVVALTMLLAYVMTHSLWAAALAGALLLVTPPFVVGARTALMDQLVSFFISFAAYAAWQRTQWLYGMALGLAVLSKSIIGVFALVPLLALRQYFWWGFVLAALIAAPWHVYEWLQHGNVFWQEYLGTHVLERYETNLFGDPALQTDYVSHLFWFVKVLTGLFLVSLVGLLVYGRLLTRTQWRALGLSLGMVAAMLVLFFTAQTRAFTYLLPLYPWAALSVALSFYWLAHAVKKGSGAAAK